MTHRRGHPRRRRRVPGPAPGVRRASARLPGLGRDLADAAAGDRRDDRATTPRRAPRSTAASTRSPSRRPTCSRARASGSPTGCARPRGDDLHRQRDRGASTSSPTRGAARTSAPATSSCSPRWSTTRTSSPGSCSARSAGAELAYVPVLDDGQLDLDALDALLARGPKLLAVAHVSNVLGTINPVEEIVRRAHAAGAVVVVDGSQAVPQMPVDLRAIDADFYAWTGHKAYGPTGIGVLHGRRELLEEMPPFIGGGHMIRTVGDNESTWTDLPLEVRGRHLADRRGDRARRGGRLDPGARDRAHPRPRDGARRRGAGAAGRGPRAHAPRPADAAERGRAGLVRARGRPPARRGRDPRPRGRLRPHRPPLHPAADAPPRRRRHDARVVRRAQHRRPTSTGCSTGWHGRARAAAQMSRSLD